MLIFEEFPSIKNQIFLSLIKNIYTSSINKGLNLYNLDKLSSFELEIQPPAFSILFFSSSRPGL